MDAFMGIIFGAVLVEAITTALKPIWNPDKRTVSPSAILALLVGLGIAFGTGMDLCAAAGVKMQIPIVPQLITGILISRGANYMYDILAQISASVKKQTSQGGSTTDTAE